MNTALLYAAIAAMFGAVLVPIALPFAPPESLTARDIGWSLAAGVAVGGAMPLLMIGMARGPIAIVAPVLGLVSIAVPAIVGPLVGDRLTGLEVIGLLIAFPAAGLVSASNHRSETSAPVAQAIAFGAGAGLMFGASAVFFGQTSTSSGIAPGVVAQATTAVLLATVTILTGNLVRVRREAVGLAGGVGVLTAIAVFLSVLAYQRGPVAIVAAVIGLAPGPAVVLARILVHEEIRRVQLIGFGLGVVAVILFAFG